MAYYFYGAPIVPVQPYNIICMLWLFYALSNRDIVARGDSITKVFIRTLLSELRSAIKNKGLADAVSYCSHKAIPITDSISSLYGVSIKRTSLKYRNPLNKPDKYEVEAIRFFIESLRKGKKVEYYLQKVNIGNKSIYRYYKPLFIKPLCLNCHGVPRKNIPAEVLKVLKKRYPNDKAIGYSVGDFRGVIRIEFGR